MKRAVLVLLTLPLLFTRPVVAAPFQDAELAEQLPDSTLAYVRVPHIASLLATPKGNSLDPVLSNPDRALVAQNIVSGLLNSLGAIEPDEVAPITDFLNSLRSPIEIAVVATPGPVAIISVATDARDQAGFEQWLGGAPGGLPLSLAPANDGLFAIEGMPAAAFADFDASSGRVNILAGQALNPDSAARTMEMLDGGGAILADTSAIDTSGQGLIAWVNVERSLPMAQLFIPAEQYSQMQQFGLETVRAVQLGLGVADGRSRFSMSATLNDSAERKLPALQHQLTAEAAGSIDAVMQLGLPSADDWQRLETLLEGTLEGDQWTNWQFIKNYLLDAYGFDIQQVARAFGPDMTLIVDEAGESMAIRIRDKAAYREWLSALESASLVEHSIRRVGRQQIHIATVKEDQLALPEKNGGDVAYRLAQLAARINSYYYWIEDGDYIYLNTIPQPLIARANVRKRVSVGKWLRETQGMSLDNALIGGSWNTRHLPRRLYHIYLELMQLAADAGDTPFDVFDMPTAQALDLPEQSSMGMSLNFGPDQIGFEWVSESSPFDFFYSGSSVTTVAVVGVLAAIAIPAYQDYTIRAEVSEGIFRAETAKAMILEYQSANGRLPNLDEADALTEMLGIEGVYVAAGGVIEVEYPYGSENLAGGLLLLEPYPDGFGGWAWSCSGTIEEKYLPSACRGNPLPEGY